eukprot:COSAG06_NODE_55055_length_291_cov_1.072917_2_plen_59_part_01
MSSSMMRQQHQQHQHQHQQQALHWCKSTLMVEILYSLCLHLCLCVCVHRLRAQQETAAF